MKRIFIVVFAIMMTCVQAYDEDACQALYGAVDSAKSSLAKAPFGQASVAILPIPGDNGVILGRLKNIMTDVGVKVVEGKEDPMWNEILKEIAWDERKDDILDPATIVKFGKLKAAKILVYGRVLTLDKNAGRIYAEIELHATDLETKRHIWGGNFAYRFYCGGDIQGIVALNASLRELLKRNFSVARDSMLSPEYKSKLGKINSVTVIPLSGDINQYLTGLAIENLTMTRHIPKKSQTPSHSQVRASVRAGQLGTDGIFFGAVRDLSRKHVPAKDTMKETAYDICVDIQLFLEDAKTGGILWSKTITLSETEMVPKNLTDTEKAKIETLGFMGRNWYIFAAAIGILALIIVIKIIRSAGNVR